MTFFFQFRVCSSFYLFFFSKSNTLDSLTVADNCKQETINNKRADLSMYKYQMISA